jgi:hypothetical protein
MKRIFLLFLPFWAFCADYDCIIVGSSPASLFEALYQKAIGKRVLILESSHCLGGAWQSITVCGVEQVDLGCHKIGKNQELAEFFQEYAGCQIVPLDKPEDPNAEIGENGFYFASGCHELIDHLAKLLQTNSIEILFEQHVCETIVNEERKEVAVRTANKQFTTNKVIMTPYTRFCEENEESNRVKFYHLYLLINDPTPPKFSYSWGIQNTVRMNNITHFVDLKNTGRQLIILQTKDLETLQKGELIVDQLKQKGLIDPCAYLICSQSYIYSQWASSENILHKQFPKYFDLLDTNHLIKLQRYINKWKEALSIYPPTL